MLSASTASPSPVHEAVASIHALSDAYVAANPKAEPVPVMTKAEIDRLVLRGLVERAVQPSPNLVTNHPDKDVTHASQKKMGRPSSGAIAAFQANQKRRMARYHAKKQLPLVETKQPQTWNSAKLHEEVTTEFRAREKGDNP